MQCVVCAKPIEFSEPTVDKIKEPGKRAKHVTRFDPHFLQQHPYCPPPATCGDTWRNRMPHLFKVTLPDTLPSAEGLGETLLKVALQSGMGSMLDDKDFAALQSVSKQTRSFAIGSQHKDAHKPATHYDKQTTAGVAIVADEMLDIAILAYHGALEVKAAGKPIILYRIADKGALTPAEKLQTLSGRIRVKISTGSEDKEVWPLEKTAAWIQGAMRARVSFLLLSDPRGNLKGGKDGSGDAVYVRELHQILCSHYEIAKAATTDLTEKMRSGGTQAFILKPKSGTESAPIPLIPKMSRHMAASNTWDGSVSSLSLSDAPTLIRDSLKTRFEKASSALGGIPEYVKRNAQYCSACQ